MLARSRAMIEIYMKSHVSASPFIVASGITAIALGHHTETRRKMVLRLYDPNCSAPSAYRYPRDAVFIPVLFLGGVPGRLLLLGAVPIALGYGAGGEARQPLGLVVVGGLLFSQLVTL